MSPEDFKKDISIHSVEVLAAIADVMRLVNEGRTSGAAWDLASDRQDKAIRRWRSALDNVQITAATGARRY